MVERCGVRRDEDEKLRCWVDIFEEPPCTLSVDVGGVGINYRIE
jgi:hypothetical protein